MITPRPAAVGGLERLSVPLQLPLVQGRSGPARHEPLPPEAQPHHPDALTAEILEGVLAARTVVVDAGVPVASCPPPGRRHRRCPGGTSSYLCSGRSACSDYVCSRRAGMILQNQHVSLSLADGPLALLARRGVDAHLVSAPELALVGVVGPPVPLFGQSVPLGSIAELFALVAGPAPHG